MWEEDRRVEKSISGARLAGRVQASRVLLFPASMGTAFGEMGGWNPGISGALLNYFRRSFADDQVGWNVSQMGAGIIVTIELLRQG
jgi:hypothetical protein